MTHRPAAIVLLSFLIVPAAPAPGAEPAALKPIDPLVLKEATAFAQRIQNTMAEQNKGFFANALDMNAMFDRTVEGFELKPQSLASMRQGFMRGGGVRQLVDQIARQIQGGGAYRFLRITRGGGGAMVARFRMTGDSGLNYHDLHLVSDGRGSFRIPDLYVYLTGEPITQTMRRMLLPAVVNENRNIFLRKLGWENDYVRSFPQVQRMLLDVRRGRFKAALEGYGKLPAKVKQMKPLLVMRLAAINQLMLNDIAYEQKYIQAVDEYRRLYPRDAGLEMLMLDYLFVQKKWPMLAQTLDRLDRKLGGDPYLDHFRGNALVMQDRKQEARAKFRSVIKADPSLSDPYYPLLELELTDKAYAKVTQLLIDFHRDAGMTYADLKTQPLFAGYVKSDQYPKWLEYRRKTVAP